MNVQDVEVGKLKKASYNPRKITPEDFEQIKKSIEEFGFVQPLVVNSAAGREGIIIGGHQRFEVAKKMGLETVPVFWVSIPDVEREKELNIRLNKNQAQWDFDMLKNDFGEELLLETGFKPFELDDIFGIKDGHDATEEEIIPEEPAVPRAKAGDLFTLGEHRLLCGDSTSPHDVRRLMGETQADMVFTDPPYNVNYAGKGENTSNGIANDNLTKEDFSIFAGKVFENMHAAMRAGAVFYVCSGWSSYPVFHEHLLQVGFYRAGVIIWVKNNASYGWNDFRYKHEWIVVGKKKAVRVKGVSILYGWKKGSHYFRDTRDEYDVWEVPRKNSAQYRHPTEKPVWLVEKALANSSQRGETILDLFGGSGSTLIACQRLSRKVLLMEYDPKYVDVIIKRYCNFTGVDEEAIYQSAVNA